MLGDYGRTSDEDRFQVKIRRLSDRRCGRPLPVGLRLSASPRGSFCAGVRILRLRCALLRMTRRGGRAGARPYGVRCRRPHRCAALRVRRRRPHVGMRPYGGGAGGRAGARPYGVRCRRAHVGMRPYGCGAGGRTGARPYGVRCRRPHRCAPLRGAVQAAAQVRAPTTLYLLKLYNWIQVFELCSSVIEGKLPINAFLGMIALRMPSG